MDVTEAINNVVNSVKSDGLFDQFRKECLEEFERRVFSLLANFFFRVNVNLITV